MQVVRTFKLPSSFLRLSMAWLVAVTVMVATPTSVRAAPLSTLPQCAGGSLLAEGGVRVSVTGHQIYRIYLINIGKQRCRLMGYPQLSGSRNGAVYLPLHVSRHGTFAGNLVPTVLSYRMVGELILGSTDTCPALHSGGQAQIDRVTASNTYVSLMIEYPNNKGLSVLSGVRMNLACGLEESQLGWVHP